VALCVVEAVDSTVEEAPYAAVAPNATLPVVGSLVVQLTVAVVVPMPVTLTPEMTGAVMSEVTVRTLEAWLPVEDALERVASAGTCTVTVPSEVGVTSKVKTVSALEVAKLLAVPFVTFTSAELNELTFSENVAVTGMVVAFVVELAVVDSVTVGPPVAAVAKAATANIAADAHVAATMPIFLCVFILLM